MNKFGLLNLAPVTLMLMLALSPICTRPAPATPATASIAAQLALKNTVIKALRAQIDALSSAVTPPVPDILATGTVAPPDPVGLSALTVEQIHALFRSKDQLIALLRSRLASVQANPPLSVSPHPASLPVITQLPASPIAAPADVISAAPEITYHYVTTYEMTVSPGISFSPSVLAIDHGSDLFVGGHKAAMRAYRGGVYQGSVGDPDMADAHVATDDRGIPVGPNDYYPMMQSDPIFRAKDPVSGDDFVLIDGQYTMPIKGHLWDPSAVGLFEGVMGVVDDFTGSIDFFHNATCMSYGKVPIVPGQSSCGKITGLILTAYGGVYFLDYSNSCLIRMRLDTQTVDVLPSTPLTTMNHPMGMAHRANLVSPIDSSKIPATPGVVTMVRQVDIANFYISDAGNHRVLVVDSQGGYVNSFGSEGTGDGQFSDMQGIALDKAGRVYVGDGKRVEVFTPSGQYITQFGVVPLPKNVSGFAQLQTAKDITVGDDGMVYVADPYSYNIKVYAPDQQ